MLGETWGNGMDNSTWIKGGHQAPNQTPFRYPAIYGLWMSMVWILDSATASTLRLGTGENRGWLHGVLGI